MVEQKVLHSDDKAVIVSQWPSMLDLVNKQLSQYKVRTELFSGKVPIPIRNKLVEDFNNSKGGPKVSCKINYSIKFLMCTYIRHTYLSKYSI